MQQSLSAQLIGEMGGKSYDGRTSPRAILFLPHNHQRRSSKLFLVNPKVTNILVISINIKLLLLFYNLLLLN